MKEDKFIGQVDEGTLEAWKQKHGVVKGLKARGHIGYIRMPNRADLSYSSTLAQSNPMKSNEVLLDAIWLGGSEEIRKDNALFFGVSQQLAKLIEVAEVELVDL